MHIHTHKKVSYQHRYSLLGIEREHFIHQVDPHTVPPLVPRHHQHFQIIVRVFNLLGLEIDLPRHHERHVVYVGPNAGGGAAQQVEQAAELVVLVFAFHQRPPEQQLPQDTAD